METTYMVIGPHFEIEVLKIRDAVIEEYIDEYIEEYDLDYQTFFKDLFTSWCADDFGWSKVYNVYELTEDNNWMNLF